ncbi:Ldh family oxidoreductase [Plastoroseomonas arctica]|nr:Ldh family oxidoreductase [Plastoroseomonas arctica]
MNVPHDRIRAQISNILLAWGMAPDLAATTTEAMAETDLLGVDSHGISMLMTYEKRLHEGVLNLTLAPRIERRTACTALVDGGAGLGHPVSCFAMNLAVDMAMAEGVGVVGVHRSNHFGAAGVYARIAARRGAIGLVTSATRGVTMVPTRGTAPVLGTNPIAFAAPAKRHLPFVLDMATTTTAANKIKVYNLNEKPLPPGWVLDAQGQPVTDSQRGYEIVYDEPEGGLSPLGGTPIMGSHKGYGLAMMVHILGGTLVGSSFSPIRNRTKNGNEPDDIGHFFMALNPTVFRPPGEFEDDLDAVIDELHATPASDPTKPVLVAGEPEDQERQRRLEHGIPIPPALDAHIRAICNRSGAQYVLS